MRRTLRPIHPPAAIESAYKKKLVGMVREMEHSCLYWLKAKYRQNESQIMDSATTNMSKELRRLIAQWKRNFSEFAEDAADWFAWEVRNFTDRNLMKQLKPYKEMGLGFDLTFEYISRKERQVLQAIIKENVNLIKSIASETLTQVEGIVLRAIQNGNDLATLTEQLTHQFGVSERRATTIARDQTAKATNNLSRQRLMDYGITRGIWMHTAAGKTYRESHVEMDGTEYNIEFGCFDENEGRAIQPAELVNCRCVCRPIIPAMGEEESGENIFGEPQTE